MNSFFFFFAYYRYPEDTIIKFMDKTGRFKGLAYPLYISRIIMILDMLQLSPLIDFMSRQIFVVVDGGRCSNKVHCSFTL